MSKRKLISNYINSTKNIIDKKIDENFENKNNIHYKIITMFNFLFEFYKIINSTFLSITVSQSCEKINNINYPCSINDNMYNFILNENENNDNNVSKYNTFIVYYNLFCFGCFIYLYYIELTREYWLTKYFIHDREYKEYYLHKYKEKYNDLFNELKKKNKYYFNIYKILFVIYLLNVILSGIFIFNYRYLNEKTIFTFMTNVSLSWVKIFNGLIIAHNSNKYNLPISYYHLYNLVFNEINILYKYEKEEFKSESLEEYKDNVDMEKAEAREQIIHGKKLKILHKIQSKRNLFDDTKRVLITSIKTKPDNILDKDMNNILKNKPGLNNYKQFNSISTIIPITEI